MEAVLIHKHHAGLSPRLIPGSSPRSALQLFLAVALLLSSKKLEETLPRISADSKC